MSEKVWSELILQRIVFRSGLLIQSKLGTWGCRVGGMVGCHQTDPTLVLVADALFCFTLPTQIAVGIAVECYC